MSEAPHKDNQSGNRLKVLAYFLGLVGVIFALIGADVGENASSEAFVFAFFAMGCWLIALVLYDRGKRHQLPDARQILEESTNAPILYLRSFDDDNDAEMDEQRFAAILEEAGPFVAIGRPGDKLPPLGASRFYLADEEWKRTVAGLINQSALVVLRAGKTQGLLWELSQCSKRLSPSQLAVLVPRDKDAYARFRDNANSAGLKTELPEYPEKKMARFKAGNLAAIMHFSDDWVGQMTFFESATFKGGSYEFASAESRADARFRSALQPVAQQTGLSIDPPQKNYFAILGQSYVLIVILVCAALLALGMMGIIE